MLKDKLTILVCSCDRYEDLWIPFFTLLRKYWGSKDVRILLNTESLGFSFDGLEIECVHAPGEKYYGQRMLNALSHVDTKYVLPLLDDFFLRAPVKKEEIEKIISWMEKDRDIAYFNCDPNAVYVDWEVDKYPGFKRIPPGNPYTFSMQAAIWRTDLFIKSWVPKVNPWEWETLTNARSYRWRKKKFYCIHNIESAFLDYGHYRCGDIWGVYRGKWCIDDVGPLFEKEKIIVDFSERGIYNSTDKAPSTPLEGWGTFEEIERCLGKNELLRYKLFNRYCQILTLLKRPVNWDYYKFLRDRARKRFLKKHLPK